MSDEEFELDEPQYVDVQFEDGTTVNCRVCDVVDFEGKTYTLLLPSDEEDEEDSEVIVMEFVEDGDEGYFQNIEDEGEFNRVCEYIQSLYEEDEEDEEK